MATISANVLRVALFFFNFFFEEGGVEGGGGVPAGANKCKKPFRTFFDGSHFQYATRRVPCPDDGGSSQMRNVSVE